MVSQRDFSLATPDNEAQVRQLLRDNPLSGDLHLALQREPDAFHAAGVSGDRSDLILAYRRGERQLLGTGGRFELDAFINGRATRLGYLGELRLVADHTKEDMRGAVVMCPPSALNDRWSRRLPEPITAVASGWMRVRQRARQRNVELPLVISDHADWSELTRTIREVDAYENWITHGREDALLRWCQLHQRRARALALVGYEDEDD